MDTGPEIRFGVIGYEQPTFADCIDVANASILPSYAGMPGGIEWWETVRQLMLHGY